MGRPSDYSEETAGHEDGLFTASELARRGIIVVASHERPWVVWSDPEYATCWTSVTDQCPR